MNVWLVKDGELVEYQRTGHCTQCGECCRRTITYEWSVQKGKDLDEDEEPRDYSEHEGGTYIWYYGVWWFFRTTRIEELKDDSACDSFSKPHCCEMHDDPQGRRAVCFFWPYHPDDLKHFPKCGFKFEEVDDA